MKSFGRYTLIGLTCTVLLFLAPKAQAAFPRPALGDKAMVATAHAEATKAGLSILKKGGNAVDAAVAATFAISVVLPYSAGIGGGGFALVRDGKSGDIAALDFRERAPAGASRDMYLDESGKPIKGASTDGYLSVAVPGTVAGMVAMHKKGGKLSWSKCLAPAIKLAQSGFKVSELYAKYVEWRKDVLLKHKASRKVFTKDGEPLQRGDKLVQKDLAKTLKRIAKNPKDFYSGTTAKKIVKDMKKNGGLITLADLKAYEPTWREPICGPYRGHEVCSMPPPSSGGVHMIQILRLIETLRKGKVWHRADDIHVLIEAMRIAYADRAEHLGDPEFSEVPAAGLTSGVYAFKRRRNIDVKRATPSSKVGPGKRGDLVEKGAPKESHDTSHLTVADKKGNVVSLTFTVNYGFGSGVVVPGTGILLNDEMDDFSVSPGVPNAYGLVGGEANAVAPKKIPLSSMTPTIVEKEGKFAFATGSPGGSTIITTSLQVVLHIIDQEMNSSEAVSAPRLHHQWKPDIVKVEKNGFDAMTLRNLRHRGHKVEVKEPWGNASAIILHEDGTLEGAADPRGEGTAAGL